MPVAFATASNGCQRKRFSSTEHLSNCLTFISIAVSFILPPRGVRLIVSKWILRRTLPFLGPQSVTGKKVVRRSRNLPARSESKRHALSDNRKFFVRRYGIRTDKSANSPVEMDLAL